MVRNNAVIEFSNEKQESFKGSSSGSALKKMNSKVNEIKRRVVEKGWHSLDVIEGESVTI